PARRLVFLRFDDPVPAFGALCRVRHLVANRYPCRRRGNVLVEQGHGGQVPLADDAMAYGALVGSLIHPHHLVASLGLDRTSPRQAAPDRRGRPGSWRAGPACGWRHGGWRSCRPGHPPAPPGRWPAPGRAAPPTRSPALPARPPERPTAGHEKAWAKLLSASP